MITLNNKVMSLLFFIVVIFLRGINPKGLVWIIKEICVLNLKKNLDEIWPKYIDVKAANYLIG